MTSSHLPSELSWAKAGWWQHCILGWKKGEERREVGLLELKRGWTLRKYTVCKKNRGAVFHGELTRGL